MNYYERHLGDYAKNCGHLTLLEHGIYVRLLDVYYTREAPLPEDKVARLIRAETPETLQALQNVLEEFFFKKNGHWHQARADEEIAAYVSGEPERAVKKANENNRLSRHREERANLFKALTDAGLHAPWNIPIGELRDMVSRLPEGKPETEMPPLPATATATPATATQTPIPTPHTPVVNLESKTLLGSTEPETGKVVDKSNGLSKRQAIEILDFLNAKTGHGYKPVPANTDLIVARMKEGFEVQDIKSVIAMKAREWKADDTMSKFLRPATLFNRTNFAQYHGQLKQQPDAQLSLEATQ